MKRLLVCTILILSVGLLTGCGKGSTYKNAMSLYEEGNFEEAESVFEELGDYEDSAEMVIACKYAEAGELRDAGNYEEAVVVYESIQDYEDSEEQILACRYAEAEELYNSGDYEGAAAIYETINGYEDSEERILVCQYAMAEALYDAGDYESAIAIYETIPEYEDAEAKLEDAEYKILYAEYGDVINLLSGKTWFYNGGSDTTLDVITFAADDTNATIQQVLFDGNGPHNTGSSECVYTLDSENIIVTLDGEEVLSVPYSVESEELIFGNGEYLTADDVETGLQGYWTYTKTMFGCKYETNLQMDNGNYVVEDANEGFGLSSGEYYYSGPYSGSYSIGIGTIDFGSTIGTCYAWGFNIIDGEAVPLQYEYVCSHGDGLPGQNGYNF